MRKFWEKPICGIYKITHRDSGKCYIGQSVDVFSRWQSHANLAVKRKSAIQNAFVLYGIKQFSFEVVEECSREILNEREIFWIAYFNSMSPTGYNLTSGGGQGIVYSEETRKKMSEANKNRPSASEETRAKMSASKKGKKLGPLTEEHKAKMSASTRGKAKPQVQCPHCGREGSQATMKRWHFERCSVYTELGVPKLDN